MFEELLTQANISSNNLSFGNYWD